MRLFFFVFLLLILSSVAMVTAVDGCHGDRDKDHRPRVTCAAAGFSDVPAGIEPSTKVLRFPNNLFSSLSWSSFNAFTEIYEVDLSGNKVPEVTPSGSPVLPSLSVLRLGSNRLTSLSDGSFSACPGLTELYLENNTISSLSDDTFSGLMKLEILDLTSNHIKVLPPRMLHPLPAIETLYLENNKIRVMPDDWFSQKEEVPYLFLSANPWACSCSLGYLRRYLEDYDYNVYVRDGLIINPDGESVVCDSPQWRKGTPVVSLTESDLCSAGPGPTRDQDQPIFTESTHEVPAPTTYPYPTPSETTFLLPVAANPPPPTTYPYPTPPEVPPITTPPPPTTAPPPPPPTTAPPPPPPTTAPPPPTTAPPPPPPTTAPPPPPPTTAPPPPPPTTAPPLPSSSAAASLPELHTSTYEVLTWSWYQSFTGLYEWSSHSGSEFRTEVSLVEPHVPTTLPTIRTSAESPAATVMTTRHVETTPSPPSTTPKVHAVTTTATTAVMDEVDIPQRSRVSAVRGGGVFCVWLFAGCLLLCVASAACTSATLAWLVIWYRRTYKPLSLMLARRAAGGEGVRLLTLDRREEEEEGVKEVYRSVLYIHKEGGGATERGGGDHDDGGKERRLVTLEPAGGGGGGAREEEEEKRGVYRKTMFRLLSKEEEIEGWRDVMEESRVPAEGGGGGRGGGGGGGGGRGGRGGGGSRKRYSLILREEREEAGGGREELDCVIGGWEVKRGGGGGGGEGGGEDPRSSWGEWLSNYLPSMPWAVTPPPEGGAAQ